jgi:hypothetical protein
MDEVDHYVQDRILPDYQDVATMVRELMRECAPHATELISYGQPMWKGMSHMAWITPGKQGISFGFTYGGLFEDRFGLLKGSGKHAKNVRLRTRAEANQEALRDYIQQALEHDRA